MVVLEKKEIGLCERNSTALKKDDSNGTEESKEGRGLEFSG